MPNETFLRITRYWLFNSVFYLDFDSTTSKAFEFHVLLWIKLIFGMQAPRGPVHLHTKFQLAAITRSQVINRKCHFTAIVWMCKIHTSTSDRDISASPHRRKPRFGHVLALDVLHQDLEFHVDRTARSLVVGRAASLVEPPSRVPGDDFRDRYLGSQWS